jgi:hypothetical protein
MLPGSLSISLRDKSNPIVNVSLIGPLLFQFELDGILAVLSKELAYALLVIAVQLVIVSEAQQLGDVRLRLPLHHLEEVGERDQIFVPRERLLILELEEHLVLPTLIQRIEDLHYDRNEDKEVSQSAQDVLACDQCYDSNDG